MYESLYARLCATPGRWLRASERELKERTAPPPPGIRIETSRRYTGGRLEWWARVVSYQS